MNGFTPVLLGKDEPDTGRTVQVFICCNKGGERNLEGNSSFQLLHSQTWGGKREDFMIGKAQLVAVIAGSARGRGHSHRRGWLEPSSSPWHQLQGQQNRVTRNGEGDTTRARTRLLNSRSSAGAPPREWGGVSPPTSILTACHTPPSSAPAQDISLQRPKRYLGAGTASASQPFPCP